MRYFLACLLCAAVQAQDPPVVFRSDVSLSRVDAQVVDSRNRTITGLRAADFVLWENRRPQEIRNFASENTPIDILLLLDVSRSMKPHIMRIALAAHNAARVLTGNDRLGIMVFDTITRLRMPLQTDRSDLNEALATILSEERFNGGTRITSAMLSAAEFVERAARPEARRAIVIVTDDGSQDARNEPMVRQALSRADIVLSFLDAPDLSDQLPGLTRYPYRPPYPQTRWPGMPYDDTHSAGVALIARYSGGDTYPIGDAYALENTFMRLRQRYALHFNSSDTRSLVSVDLTDAARRQYPDAEIRFRRVFISGNTRQAGPLLVTRAHAPAY